MKPYYLENGEEIRVFEHSEKNNLPILIKGPTGCGKTRFIEYMASKLNRQLITIACHEETSAIDLLGRHVIKGAETVWQDGPLTKAVKDGAIIYLDEIAEARPDVIVAIHSLTDHRRILYLDRINESITAPDNFMLVASFNPGYQTGWKELKPSTRQRFVGLSFNYPEHKLETQIITEEIGIDSSISKKLVKLAHDIRNLTELGLAESVSTRLLVDAAKLMKSGLPKRLACQVAITEPLTDDNDISTALNDIITMIF